MRIPDCADRTILCSEPPVLPNAKTTYLNEPDSNNHRIVGTEIHYECTKRGHAFDYPVGEDFVSYTYTENLNNIKIKCTKDSVWKVEGGIEGVTCDNFKDMEKLSCRNLYIPDCVDRTVYCTHPPDAIEGGLVNLIENPSPVYKKDGGTTTNFIYKKYYSFIPWII